MQHMAAERISDPSYDGAKTVERGRNGARRGDRISEGDDRDGGTCVRKYVLSSYKRLEKREVSQHRRYYIAPHIDTRSYNRACARAYARNLL